MKTARTQILVLFFLTVSTIVTYTVLTRDPDDAALSQAQLALKAEQFRLAQARLQRENILEAERLRLKKRNLQRMAEVRFYSVVGLLSAGGLALLILAVGYGRARLSQASVHFARIGQHSAIPVHQHDLRRFYPIAVNLSLAEIEASTSTAHETAYQISRQMLEDITAYTRTIAGPPAGRSTALLPGLNSGVETPATASTPTFADLLRSGLVAPGKPLVLGYDQQGQPQTRTLHDLKAVAIAGWQGSGKTLSTAYLVASSVLAYGVHAYIIDPHHQHPESLSTLLRPLERIGQVTLVNPFETPALLEELNHTLDRRLTGEDANAPGILLVIDELARLVKSDCFDVLIAFLERCTEETRKANITFLGGSPKWTARYFQGRADIRGCMNSVLIHKTKPSQAELLLEDAREKNLVKQLQQPGQAILATDYALPTLVTMPLCTRPDMDTVADLLSAADTASAPAVTPPRLAHDVQEPERSVYQEEGLSETFEAPAHAADSADEPPSEVIAFSRYRKHDGRAEQTNFDPARLTVNMILNQLQRRKSLDADFTQTALARQVGMSPGHLSKILNGQRPLSDQYKQPLYEALFQPGVPFGGSHPSWPSAPRPRLRSTA
jgi:hypothetical protein